MVEVMKIMATSFKRSHASTAALSASNPEAGYRQHMSPLETPGHSLACLGQFLMGSLLLSPGSLCTQGFVCALQEGLCHTQVCCPQKPCSRPLMTHASTRDSWTLTGKSGSVSCRVTAPGSRVLMHTRYSLCPPRVCFPNPVLAALWWV